MAAPTPKEIRQARAFLHERGIRPADIRARDFAAAAAELGKSFIETLRLIATLFAGGQGMGPAPIASQIAEGE